MLVFSAVVIKTTLSPKVNPQLSATKLKSIICNRQLMVAGKDFFITFVIPETLFLNLLKEGNTFTHRTVELFIHIYAGANLL